jgi:hypothetical protein
MSLEMVRPAMMMFKTRKKMKKKMRKKKALKRKRKRLHQRSSLTELWSRRSSVKSVCTISECLDLDLSWPLDLSTTHASQKKHLMLELPICSLLFIDKRNKTPREMNSRGNNKLPEKREKLMRTLLISFLTLENGPKLKLNLTLKRRSNTFCA